ncbi:MULTISPECIES: ABC transporter permease [Micrococcales]|uniref:ABC transporter permease n=1 Tax=Micrococcales TaxID=85006 RepID=UPI000C799B0E|nr:MULTISPECIES: ABC transporter permease [Micrococcales]MCT1363827.1 ABC transporter permease [Microbacterium sp. p3-SID131]MCT1375692.1 ABC transporter permease [Microbacterium sp. p3-SID337]MCT1396226.1 ABC transporter permease [Microbacterium sp. p3-SID338]MCZ0708396.1 ABC transporter permease [Microbacterium paraoxydans]MDH5132225.1 ABC transporter permease [Microbacterium sp. RD10]
MIKYLARRALGWLLMIVVATNLTYFLAWGFLDPRSNYVGRRPPLTEEQIVNTLAPRNLSDTVPLIERWWTWFTGILLRWDWGVSPTGGSVNEQVAYRMWVSAELVLGATILTTVLGIALGVYTASRQYKLADRIGQATSIITLNIPIVVAAFAIVLLAIGLNNATGTRIFYVTGNASQGVEGFFPTLIDVLQHLTLPTIALVLTGYASIHFLQRSLLLDNINADYVRTARAKGLTKQQAIRKHALRTSLIPVATQVAFTIPAIFTGAVLTETIFAWNGMGRYFIETITKNDIHGTVAIAAFGAVLTAIGAILADIAVVVLDPRVRVS